MMLSVLPTTLSVLLNCSLLHIIPHSIEMSVSMSEPFSGLSGAV